MGGAIYSRGFLGQVSRGYVPRAASIIRRGRSNLVPIFKLVRAYDAVGWEIFISEWQKGLQGYASVKRLGGAGDHGLT